jgi:hypothetical protein
LAPREHSILNALAAAYAEVGDFDGAVRSQTASIEAAADDGDPDDMLKSYQRVLRLFQEKKPLRRKSP